MSAFLILMYAAFSGAYCVFVSIHFVDKEVFEHDPTQLSELKRLRAKYLLCAPIWPIMSALFLARAIASQITTATTPLPTPRSTEEIEAEKEVQHLLEGPKP